MKRQWGEPDTSDIILDAVLKPFSQLLVIAILIELVLMYYIITRCRRKETRAILILLLSTTFVSQVFAISSDSFNGGYDHCRIATAAAILLPALMLTAVFTYMRGALPAQIKTAILLVICLGAACIGIAVFQPFETMNLQMRYALYLLLFIYIGTCSGGAIGEILLGKHPEEMLMLLTAIPSTAMWLLFLVGFFPSGPSAFSVPAADSNVKSAVMTPLFMFSILYIPFCAAVMRTNPVIIPDRNGDGSASASKKRILERQVSESQTTKIEPNEERTMDGERVSPRIKAGIYFIREPHPKYSYHIMRKLVVRGAKYIVLTKEEPESIAEKYSIDANRIIHLSARNANGNRTYSAHNTHSIHPQELGRLVATINLFADKNRNAVIMLDGLDYIFQNNEQLDSIETLLGISAKIRETGSVMLIPTCLLYHAEILALRAVRGYRIEAPDLPGEIASLVKSVVGFAGDEILRRAVLELRRNTDGDIHDACTATTIESTIEYSDLPALSEILRKDITDLGIAESTNAGRNAWKQRAEQLSEAIKRLGRVPGNATGSMLDKEEQHAQVQDIH